MLKQVQNIVAITMAVLILAASVGLPVNEHICLSSNFYELSFLPIEKCANKPVVKHACCTKGISSACGAPSQTLAVSKAQNPCCSYESKYIAFRADLFSPQSGSTQIQSAFSLTFPALAAVLPFFVLQPSGAKFEADYLIPPPPLLPAWGNAACALLQVFIC
ncbi:MAG TPA: hypothetical protein PK239_02655 [Chitinophagales bacterium]|nr:hypothetical protein [Chitinophagales bacterium]HRK26170.1 hypothetical protein [Chitinophagales bacterium]